MRLERAATGRADLLPRGGSRCAFGFEGKYPGRVRPRRQAPSLTGHHMLPRTTQQSHSAVRHGERVSDRTMVGHDHPCGCCSAQWANRNNDAEGRRSTTCRHRDPANINQGWMPENYPLSAAGGEIFSLDIPFYRTLPLKREGRGTLIFVFRAWGTSCRTCSAHKEKRGAHRAPRSG